MTQLVKKKYMVMVCKPEELSLNLEPTVEEQLPKASLWLP